MNKEGISNNQNEDICESSYNNLSSDYNRQLIKKYYESTCLAAYQDQVLSNIISRTVIEKFGRIASSVNKNITDCQRFGNCLTDQCTTVCQKISKYIDMSKDIEWRIRKNNITDMQKENYEDELLLDTNEKPEFIKEEIRYLINESIKKCDRNRTSLTHSIEIKKQNIERLKEDIENARLRLESVNELSQRFEKSSLDEEDEIITQDDINNTREALQKLLNIANERTKMLEDLCKEAHIELADVDKIVSQTDIFNKNNNNNDNSIKELKLEIIQLLSKMIDEAKNQNEDNRKLLTEKKIEQSTLEQKYNKILDEIESFIF